MPSEGRPRAARLDNETYAGPWQRYKTSANYSRKQRTGSIDLLRAGPRWTCRRCAPGLAPGTGPPERTNFIT